MRPPAQPASGSGRSLLLFVTLGGLNTVITTLLYWLLLALHWHPSWAYSMVFALGLVLAWWLNGRYTFRRPTGWRGLALYPLVYLPCWALGQALLAGLLHLGWPAWLAGPATSLALVPCSFGLNRLFFSWFPTRGSGNAANDGL